MLNSNTVDNHLNLLFLVASCRLTRPLKVMTLNTWGLSWFRDLSVPSDAEPFNVTQVQ